MANTQQSLADLDDDFTPNPPAVHQAVELRSARDYSLVTTALAFRADDLKKLAKRNREDGYTAEARAVESDAGAIEEYILPQFHAQRELPLVTHENVKAMIKDALWAAIHRFSVMSDQGAANAKDDEARERMQGKREQDLAVELAHVVAMYAVAIADGSYAAGFSARSMTAEALAARSLPALRGFPDAHAG